MIFIYLLTQQLHLGFMFYRRRMGKFFNLPIEPKSVQNKDELKTGQAHLGFPKNFKEKFLGAPHLSSFIGKLGSHFIVDKKTINKLIYISGKMLFDKPKTCVVSPKSFQQLLL